MLDNDLVSYIKWRNCLRSWISADVLFHLCDSEV